MYIALKHAHTLTAALTVLLTTIWSIWAWRSRIGVTSLAGKDKAIYVAHRIVAGLAGITGLAVTFACPWRAMLFPYIGLAAFVMHGVTAGASKRFFASEADAAKRQVALLIQVAALVISGFVMAIKPV
jgi:hypothetical protein